MSDDLLEKLTKAERLRSSYDAPLAALLSAATEIPLQTDRLNKALVVADWNTARVRIAGLNNLSRDLHMRFVDAARRESELIAAVRDLAEPLQEAVDDLPGPHDPDKIIADALSLVRSTGADFPDNLEQLLRQVVTEGTDQVEAVFGSYKLRRHEILQERVASLVTLGAIRAIWVRQLADVSASVEAIPVVRKNEPLYNAQLFADVKQSLTNFEQLLRDRQRALFESVSTDERLESAGALIEQVDEGLRGLAEAQALMYLWGYALRKLGKGDASEKVGAKAAAAGALAREAIGSLASAGRIAMRLAVGHPDEEVDGLLTRGSDRAFDVELPRGAVTQLHHLGEVADGALVEVGGYVQAIEFGHTGDKLISRARLKDPSSGAATTIAAVFSHLRHMGVTGGCYIRASGVFRKASELAAGDAAVEVDRLPLTELGKSSWRVAFLNLSRPWFEVWRNGQNMAWSWAVHRVGGASLGLEGAAEPVFTPFLRG